MSALVDRRRSRTRPTARAIAPLTAYLVVAAAALSISGCSRTSEQKYDISPIFPLSSNTCVKYHGRTEGEGLGARCWVTLADCKKAAADWQQAMKRGGVGDAILFRCD
jgi:hypothetical protein